MHMRTCTCGMHMRRAHAHATRTRTCDTHMHMRHARAHAACTCRQVRLLYQGGVHYDALELTEGARTSGPSATTASYMSANDFSFASSSSHHRGVGAVSSGATLVARGGGGGGSSSSSSSSSYAVVRFSLIIHRTRPTPWRPRLSVPTHLIRPLYAPKVQEHHTVTCNAARAWSGHGPVRRPRTRGPSAKSCKL